MRTVTTVEPEFTEVEKNLLVASRAVEDETGPHGHLMSEAFAGDPADAESPHFYKVGLPIKDHAQAAIDQAREKYKSEYPDSPMHGLQWVAEKVER